MTQYVDAPANATDARPILVTGAAGFIGFHLAKHWLDQGQRVVGIDNINDYYSTALKRARLEILRERQGFTFEECELADNSELGRIFDTYRPQYVVNLAAQAGVRYSIENPHAYASSNLSGFLNILEQCRAHKVEHLVYASSSSVYGGNKKLPFTPTDSVDHPVSLYAATKKSNELMAHSYSHLFGLPATALRFFTVYGPWGRPDMAYYKFANAICAGRPIQIYNEGRMARDFTYIDDIVVGLARVTMKPAQPDPNFDYMAPNPGSSWAPHRVFNIGNRRQEALMTMIELLEKALGREAVKEFLPMQPGDVEATWADVSDLEDLIGPLPHTPLEQGITHFAKWHREYHSEDY